MRKLTNPIPQYTKECIEEVEEMQKHPLSQDEFSRQIEENRRRSILGKKDRKRLTKRELIAMLSDYPDDAQIFFNDDIHNSAPQVVKIHFVDDDFIPALSPDKPCPKIFIHIE